MSATTATSSVRGFASFGFAPSLVRNIAAAGYREPRPIQAKAIPAALAGRDVLGLAQTGTGKTAAFVLPVLEHILLARTPGPCALILAPTRELANQIGSEIATLARGTRVKAATVFGGVRQEPQVRALRARPDIVVACPGRLLDLMGQGAVDLARVEILVLDEADTMFDMGFLPAIRRILAALPAERQTLMFSATMPPEIRSLTGEVMKGPFVVELANSSPAATIDHAFYPVPSERKIDLLHHLLGEDDFRSAIVFLRTKHRAKRLAQQLDKAGLRAVALQGNMSQSQRTKAMGGFRSGHYDILVATDIAARGIDVAGVSHVINFDVPDTPVAYTHRIGRTGRAELAGKACTLVCKEETSEALGIERALGYEIPRVQVPGFEGVVIGARRPERRDGGGQGKHAPGQEPRRVERRQAQRPAGPADGGRSGAMSRHPGVSQERRPRPRRRGDFRRTSRRSRSARSANA